MYAWQSRVRIFLPLAVSLLAVFGTAHFTQILNTVVGLDAINMINLLRKTMAH